MEMQTKCRQKSAKDQKNASPMRKIFKIGSLKKRSGAFKLGFVEEIEVKFCRDRRPDGPPTRVWRSQTVRKRTVGDAGPYKKGAAWRLFCFYQHPDKPKFEILKHTDKPKFEDNNFVSYTKRPHFERRAPRQPKRQGLGGP